MEKIKIFDAEMHLMNKIWDSGTIKAIDLANWATENLGWKKNSTYSMLKKLLEKGAVKREEPGFILIPLVTREEVAQEETTELVEKMYKGNMKMFLTSLISHKDLDKKDVEALKDLINDTQEE
ncbi:MAG: BlaI/MecI/CopY family transcriptional regulator [Oscillospiraceae bacterium]